MSTINVTNIKGKGGASPNLPDGANVTGVLTATSFVGSGANLTGLANTDFINAEQVTVVGIVTANSYRGDGSNLTGVGESIAPHFYNPDVSDTSVTVGTGIGITFNKKVLQGSSGTATLKIVNAGVAGTTIQNWGVSSTTYNVTSLTLDALVSDLIVNQTYQLDIPEGFSVSSTGTSYAGTAYTFTVQDAENKLWIWGRGVYGQTAQNSEANYSSPVQIPSPVAWKAGWDKGQKDDSFLNAAVKTDGTLWMWGYNNVGALGQNNKHPANYSSPVQLPGTNWSTVTASNANAYATKTDGTLWAWGYNAYGSLGQNTLTYYSSPVQIPGTTWSQVARGGLSVLALKTDNTLWAWGNYSHGQLAQNNEVRYSSPVQIPGTNWSNIAQSLQSSFATKTDGTLWVWGGNEYGTLGLNNPSNNRRSSPVQLPGTTWAQVDQTYRGAVATKTDGTLWMWGSNSYGQMGQNDIVNRSSPTQVPGSWAITSKNKIHGMFNSVFAIKQDGTLWSWGNSLYGMLGQNNLTKYSSPVQIGSNTDWDQVGGFSNSSAMAIQKDQTP